VTWLRKAVATVIAALRPWPARHERKAAIAAATAEKERSRAAAARARAVQEQITRLARENHFALAITEQIIRGHRENGD
jgi:hypothetical protein